VVNGKNFYMQDISVVSFNDLTITNGDIQDRVAVRNNFYASNGASVGDKLTDGCGYGLIIGGNLYFSNDGAVYPLNQTFFVGGTASLPSYFNGQVLSCASFNSSPGCVNSYFDSLAAYWNQFSNTFMAQTDNAQITIDQAGIATLSCNSTSDNYFVHISASNFNQITGYNPTNCRTSSNWILNVVGNDDITITGNPPPVTGFILVNIGSTGRVNIATSVQASIVATQATINMVGGTIYGAVIAGNFSNVVQINEPTNCPAAVAFRQTSPSCADPNSGNTGSNTGATGSNGNGASNSGSATTGNSGANSGANVNGQPSSNNDNDSGAVTFVSSMILMLVAATFI